MGQIFHFGLLAEGFFLLLVKTTSNLALEFVDNQFLSSLTNNVLNSIFSDTVDCLEDWEKNLQNLGDAFLDTSARSKCARARFTIGLLALHNFQFDLAIEMFEKAEEDEKVETGRSFPMAMWGAAMATTQILWQTSDCEKGRKYLERIEKNRDWVTEKENAYIETGFALYPNHIIPCEQDEQYKREKRIMEAMKKITLKYPEEDEAKLFYAVQNAAVAAQSKKTSHKKDEMEKPIDLLKDLEQKHPSHPGVLHYITHVFDAPEYYYQGNKLFVHKMIEPIKQQNHAASMGKRAANKYLKVATSSCHGLHMPSHIFMRFGNWKMSRKANLLSIKVKLVILQPIFHFFQ